MSEAIYGLHAVNALLKCHPQLVERLLIQERRKESSISACQKLAQAAGIAVEVLPRQDLEKHLGKGGVHQGIVAICQRLPIYSEADLDEIVQQAAQPGLILILDGVQDPHNLGACLRVANGFGASCVIAPKDKTATLTPTAIKVSTGAAFTTPFVQVTNLARCMRELQSAGIWIVGMSADTETPISEVDMTGNIAVVMGAEGTGMRHLTQKHCDYLAKIPMTGTVESFNVSVATGVCLYEVSRQRANAAN